MLLHEAIRNAGMTPPEHIPMGRFVRFPGNGKKRGNSAGWCRRISDTLAVFGDWSTGLTEVWRDNAHVDSSESRLAVERARRQEREMAARLRERQREVAAQAQALVLHAKEQTHPYLMAKGFPTQTGLVHDGLLVIPVRDVADYSRIISAQLIDAEGGKKFLPGGRAKGGVFALGCAPDRARHVVLCEGFATALSIYEALKLLPGPPAVLACFSANNLVSVAGRFPAAVVAADNDASGTGERAAQQTGLRWSMPCEPGTDFNDLHKAMGIYTVVQRMRELLSG